MARDSMHTDKKGRHWVIRHDRTDDGRRAATAAGPVPPGGGAIGDAYRCEADTEADAERRVIAKIEAAT